MGWERKTIEISGSVSRHNSERDDRDDALWAELTGRLRMIVDDPRYEPLMLIENGLGSGDE